MAAAYTVGTVKTHSTPRPLVLCSFCHKSEHEVEWLVAAPPIGTAFICDACTEAAVSTLKEARRIQRAQRYR